MNTMETIRQKMSACGVWEFAKQMQVYTSEQFVNEFDDKMPNDLKDMLLQNVNRMQKYLDNRILEPKN
jgi:hypothetical protein